MKSFNGIIHSLQVKGAGKGPLLGQKFVAKDLFDIKGEVTGLGNLAWATSHKPASKNAEVIDKLLSAGSMLIGKSCTDEFAFSVDGINMHFGAPLNTQYPDRIPGGSSSGSASAVAAGIVSFALGTDTGGSIRIPASYCGIHGFRPTHGFISTEGVAPLAPMLDTVGVLAANGLILQEVVTLLLKNSAPTLDPTRKLKLLIAEDAFEMTDAAIRISLEAAVAKIAKSFNSSEKIRLSDFGWHDYFDVYRIYQAKQAWDSYGNWIEHNRSSVAPAILERFDYAKNVPDDKYNHVIKVVSTLKDAYSRLLKGNTVLCFPTTWHLPPTLDSNDDILWKNRVENMKLSSISPLLGAPEVSIPIKIKSGKRSGLSFMAAPGKDTLLLDLIQKPSFITAGA
jgi:amidase